jgi:hypothetical protein
LVAVVVVVVARRFRCTTATHRNHVETIKIKKSKKLFHNKSILKMTSSPQPTQQPSFSIDEEANKKRLFVVDELISTERSYLSNLEAMRDLYLLPLRHLSATLVSADDVATLFPQLETIRNFSSQLLESLVRASCRLATVRQHCGRHLLGDGTVFEGSRVVCQWARRCRGDV